MINFIEGKISLAENNIFITSNDGDLNALAEEGLIDKKETSEGRVYYYVEENVDNMRFGIFIRLRDKKIEWLRLSWLDSPIRGWDDVSEKGVKDQYQLLTIFVEKCVGRPSDKKGNKQHTWRFKWGQIDVCYDLRAFQADIFIVPR